MGLDMYLEVRHYVGNKHRQQKLRIADYGDSLNPSVVDEKRISAIICEAGYWRKANAIHRWFVENVQNGNDDCQEYGVEWESLIALRDLCNRVLSDHSLAPKLLPSKAGFFFGLTDYDEYYFDDIKTTVKIIDSLTPNLDYRYSSSW